MEIIKPSCELWIQENPIDHVARCARVCYASDKTTGNNAMYNRLLDAGHNSMFRHESVYIIAPGRSDRYELISIFEDCPFVDYRIDYDNNEIYISTNRQFFMENESIQYFNEWIVSIDEFKSTLLGKEIMRYTFKVVTQISTSRELNRVSPNNIAEQSTRYVNLSKKGGAICQPHWVQEKDIEDWINGNDNATSIYYHNQCQLAFDCYNELISLGMKPQDARGVLPLDTATVCIYTYSYSEWKEIIRKRVYHQTGKAHPNAVIVCKMIEDKLKELGYEFNF